MRSVVTSEDVFCHSTSGRALESILRRGFLLPLDRLADVAPDEVVSVETRLGSRLREELPVREAVTRLRDAGKYTDRVFLVRNAVLPEYGEYTIVKSRFHAELHPRLTDIPCEYYCSAPVSVKRHTTVYVPGEELMQWTVSFPGYQVRDRSEMPFVQPSVIDLLHTLCNKLTLSAVSVWMKVRVPERVMWHPGWTVDRTASVVRTPRVPARVFR